MNNKTAILLFSRTANGEALAKGWSPSAKRNLEIANLLLNQTLATIQSAGIPFIQINESQQIGANFNEKISNALSQFYNLGYQNAIVVGSDCVDLTAKDILYAHTKIENNQNTVGPSKDGGSYLFTISKAQFDSTTFQNLSWCTSQLNDELTCFLEKRSLHEVIVLDKKFDLDSNLKGVRRALKVIKSTLSSNLENLLFQEAISVFLLKPTFHIIEQSDINRRGPPPVLAA